jgi:hypothetical protein
MPYMLRLASGEKYEIDNYPVLTFFKSKFELR